MNAAAAAATVKEVFKGARRQPDDLVAHYNNNPEVNSTHQADVLFLPKDPKTRKSYALVVEDLATRRIAARAMTGKSAADVLKALQDIYENDSVLRPPYRFECDDGGEFKGVVRQWLEKNGTVIRVGEPGRHRQQGAVERTNGILGRSIMMAQARRELETGKPNREWVAELPQFVGEINKYMERPAPRNGTASLPQDIPPPASAKEVNLLEEGTLVRRILDRPQDVLGSRLMPGAGAKTGRRAGDPTYEVKKRKIVSLVLRPGMSPRYVLEGLPHVSYARFELQAPGD